MNEKINLQDLAALLAEKMTITKKEAETFLREYFELLNEELINSGLVKIKDLGVFKLMQVEDRESVNVTTGERVLIPAHYKVAFTPDKKLAETVNEPFAFFETTEIEEESVSEELPILPEEDASEEPEPSDDEEEKEEEEKGETEEMGETEEAEPEEEEMEVMEEKEPEEKEEVITEEKSTYSRNLKNYCLNCHDYEEHRVYRKKYFKIRKKLKAQRIIIFILSVLLAAAIGNIIYMTLFNENIFLSVFHEIMTTISSLKFF